MSILSMIKYEMMKTAAENGEFNETPATPQQQAPVPAEQAPPPQPPAPPPAQDMAAVPMQEPAPQDAMYDEPTPEEIAVNMGVEAASRFLASAASNGMLTPETEKVVAETAGTIAGKIAEGMVARIAAMTGGPVNWEGPVGYDQEMQPPPQQYPEQQPMPSPGAEEAIANNVAPLN